jgi:membrane protease subunit HflC
MNRLIIIGLAVVAVLYVLFSSLYVVNEREQAIVLRFGNITDVRTEPGIYFKVPTSIVDSVQIIEDRLLRFDIADMTLQVSGGKFYEVDAFVTYRISNPRLFRERALGDLAVAEDRIATRFDAALRQVYGKREFNAALSEERTDMMEEARDLMVAEMANIGIEIVDVRILRTDLTAQVSAQTFDRMKAERLAEAALLRARGQEQAQTLKAIADRQKIEILAEASRDAEIIRGEGDATRSDIFAQAYLQDPEFFEFYRSMQSYRTALGASGTTMVWSPDSEFFRYLGGNDEVNVGTTADETATAPSPAASTPLVEPSVGVQVETPAPATAPANETPAETAAPAAETPEAPGAPAAETPAAEPATTSP